MVEQLPPDERHLQVHHRHLIGLNDADAAAWDAGGQTLLEAVTMSGPRETVRARLEGLAEQGVTEIVYQPIRPDVRRELETFAEAASGI